MAASAVWGLPDEAAGPRGALMASMMEQLQRGATAVTQIARDTTNGLFAAGGAAEANGEGVSRDSAATRPADALMACQTMYGFIYRTRRAERCFA